MFVSWQIYNHRCLPKNKPRCINHVIDRVNKRFNISTLLIFDSKTYPLTFSEFDKKKLVLREKKNLTNRILIFKWRIY